MLRVLISIASSRQKLSSNHHQISSNMHIISSAGNKFDNSSIVNEAVGQANTK